MYGSGGDALYVSPTPLDMQSTFADPAVAIIHRLGDTMGRHQVAEAIMRVFPDYKAFADHVIEAGLADSFPSGPFPGDKLIYRSKTMVEYQTPAETKGFGTFWALQQNELPIRGLATLIGKTPDLLLLAIR